MVAALCHYLPCFSHPFEVLSSRVDVLMWLIHGYAAFMARQRPDEDAGDRSRRRDGTWTELPGGKRQYHIGSMETLMGVMRARGGVL